MHRDWILNKLENYRPYDSQEINFKKAVVDFVINNKNCFESSHPPASGGHITGSAWLLNSKKTKVLLTHHRKLGRWFQLGGHSDGHANVLETSLREACEESGIEIIVPISHDIFDIDIHEIPAKGTHPPHLHYDIRFLLTTPDEQKFSISDESNDLRWVDLNEVEKFNSDVSFRRMCEKCCELE